VQNRDLQVRFSHRIGDEGLIAGEVRPYLGQNWGEQARLLLPGQHNHSLALEKTDKYQYLRPEENKLAMAVDEGHLRPKRFWSLSVMAVHPLKNLTVALGLAASLACGAVSSAYAFTETKIAPQPGQSAPAPEAPKLQLEKTDEGGLSLNAPGAGSTGETELTIPGVGSIGKVPKLDFGLELLYGGQGQGTDAPTDEQKDDVLIKGKIKHRF
jgi:hypothetical protein